MKLLRYIILLHLCLMFVSVEAKDNKSREGEAPTLEQLLSGCTIPSPSQWPQGMPFVFLADKVAMNLTPEIPLESSDTVSMRGTVWFYDSMVSEEDWMGQQLLQLRFRSPAGRYYRYSTGRTMDVVLDDAYQPSLPIMYPVSLLQNADSLMRARTYYILYNDERVVYLNDSTDPGSALHKKFVPVLVDSVTFGIETAPIRIDFTSEIDGPGYFYTSLPGSRQTSTSTALNRFLSISDPYLPHPDITSEIWTKIQYSQVQLDMTAEEVRLAWGRPSRVERGGSRTGVVELWYYSNNRILQIWDGRLSKIGIL